MIDTLFMLNNKYCIHSTVKVPWLSKKNHATHPRRSIPAEWFFNFFGYYIWYSTVIQYCIVYILLYIQYCTVLYQQYCCNSAVATVLLQRCNSTVAAVLLQQYCCNSTVATILLQQIRFRSGSGPVPVRSGSGPVPVRFRSGSGPVPVRFRSGPVPVRSGPVRFRSGSGSGPVR